MSVFHLLKRILLIDSKDPMAIMNEVYNEASGSNKVMLVEPVVLRPVTAIEQLPFGSYVKVTGTAYTLQLLNKAHNPATVYRKNDLVTQGGNVYICQQNGVVGAFDVNLWIYAAPATVGSVTILAGSVVSNGRYHNNINAAGFLVDDNSEIKKVEN